MGQPAKLGRYELRQTLGRGAMGVVYEGFDPVLGRRVAIKTILPNAAMGDDVMRDYAMRFTREAKAAARLSHPNIVQVYDFGAENDISYLVMEFVEGKELAKYFESGELFDLQDVTRLMTQLLEALELAHNAGIVHRDIKPANVMVDSEGQAKLADFGVARVSDGQDATQVGAMVGTPSYMSPEQVQGQPVDRRTDIFSAGVILYQFLTGQKPFQGGGAYTLARKIIHDDPVMPSALVASISPAYDKVIRRALAKGVDDRYQTAREFSQALNALVKRSAPDAPDDDSTRKISSADMPKATPVSAAAAPAQPESLASGLELEFWRAIKDSEDIDDYELYLTKFPSGVYAELAQRKVAKLKRASTAAVEEAANLKRQLEEEARARREAEEAAKRAADEKAKLEAQAQAQRAAQLKREAEAEAAARRAAEAAAAASVAKPVAASSVEPAKKSSMAIPAVIGVLVMAGAAGAYFMMQPKAPVATIAPAAPAQPPVQAVVPPKPEPASVVTQPAAVEAKPVEKPVREVVKAAPAPVQATKPAADPVGKAAASKAAADAAAAKAAADIAAARSAAEEAAARSAAAAAAAEQRAAAAEQRAATAEKAAADRAAAEKAAAEKAAAERVAGETAAAEKAAAAKSAAPAIDTERFAARRAARARELEWTKGGPTGGKPRSKAEIEEILRQEGLVPGGSFKPAAAAPVERPPVQQAPACTGQMRMRNMC